MVGDAAVGQLLSRFSRNEFSLDSGAMIGIEFQTRTPKVDNKIVKARIWDTAGQERYGAVTSVYYKEAVGATLVYDMTKRPSFDHVTRWLDELHRLADKDDVVMLVSNKSDLFTQRTVPTEDAKEFAENANLLFMEASALEANTVENALPC